MVNDGWSKVADVSCLRFRSEIYQSEIEVLNKHQYPDEQLLLAVVKHRQLSFTTNQTISNAN